MNKIVLLVLCVLYLNVVEHSNAMIVNGGSGSDSADSPGKLAMQLSESSEQLLQIMHHTTDNQNYIHNQNHHPLRHNHHLRGQHSGPGSVDDAISDEGISHSIFAHILLLFPISLSPKTCFHSDIWTNNTEQFVKRKQLLELMFAAQLLALFAQFQFDFSNDVE